MNYTYSYYISDTANNKVDVERLKKEIEDSSITVALDFISADNIKIYVNFKAELSDDEEEILNGIISEHSGEPLDYVAPTKVKVVEEPTPDGNNITQGNYRATSLVIDVPAEVGTYTKDVSFPYYISIASAQWFNQEASLGDEAQFIVAPDTVVGTLVSGTTSGDTLFYVQESVIGHVQLGYYVIIGGEDLGKVFGIDKEKLTITTEKATSMSHSPGELVKMNVPFVDYFYFSGVGHMQIGNSKISSSLVPPNTIMRVVYKNNSGTAKKFSIFIDYTY